MILRESKEWHVLTGRRMQFAIWNTYTITIWSMRDQMCLYMDQMQNERRKYKEETVNRLLAR